MDRLIEVQNEISRQLARFHDAIRPLFKSEPRLTLVIRQAKCPNSEIIMSDDPDGAEVLRLLAQYNAQYNAPTPATTGDERTGDDRKN